MTWDSRTTEPPDEFVALLRALPDVQPSPALEHRLRKSFRERCAESLPERRLEAGMLLAAAAAVILAVASILPQPRAAREPAVLPISAAVTALDLDGFQPIARPRMLRFIERSEQ